MPVTRLDEAGGSSTLGMEPEQVLRVGGVTLGLP